MEVANSGMYDGASALAEAALMACRVTGRERIVHLDTVSPAYLSVMRTYTEPQGLAMNALGPGDAVPEDAACVVVQSPNFLGCMEDVESLARSAHENGALLVASVDPVSLGMFRPPGEQGADIAVAEGQASGRWTELWRPLRGPLHLQVSVPAPDAWPHRRQNAGHPRQGRLRAHAADT